MGKKELTEDDDEGRQIKKTFTKKSKKILRPVFFLDTPFKVIEKIPSLSADLNPCIPKNPFTRESQCGPELGENNSNTEKVEWHVRGVSHREGGWPKEIDSQVNKNYIIFIKCFNFSMLSGI